MMNCKRCNARLRDTAKFCLKCGEPAGHKPVSSSNVCPRCGTESPPEARFCKKDGFRFPTTDEAPLTPRIVLDDSPSLSALNNNSCPHESGSVNTYTITASAGTGGTISPSGSVSVSHGASKTFTISANAGYPIASVTVDGASQGTISSYTFSNVTANHTMAATFSVKTYTISAPAGTGGTISPNGSVRVNHGSNQSFTITAGTGYHISDITVDGVSQGAISSYTFSNVTAGHTILASFSANTYTITASAGTGGTISPSGSVSVSHGASKTFTISANAGYQIASVTVDGASQGTISSYTFSNVTANHTMAATFSVKTYTISAPAGTGGTISPNGSVRVNHGSNQSFTITAGTGYHISDITVDGVSQGAISSYTFSNVTAGHTISAAFSAAPHLPSKNQNSQPLETPEHAAVTDIRFSQAESSVDDAAQSQNQKKETPHEKVATGGREAVRNNVEKERKGHQKNRPLFLVGATLVIVVVGLFSGWYFFIRQTPVAQQPLQKAVALATKENQGALVSQTAPSVKPSETNMIPASATPAPTARDTMELEERINTELKDKGIGSVSVKIGQDMKGVVRGQVNKEATKARALEIVSHNLLTNIDDRILVKTQKQKVDPGRLEKELNRALSNANLGTVTAEVNTAMVATLKGTVQSNQDKAKAVSITKSFKGLKSHKDIIFIILSR